VRCSSYHERVPKTNGFGEDRIGGNALAPPPPPIPRSSPDNSFSLPETAPCSGPSQPRPRHRPLIQGKHSKGGEFVNRSHGGVKVDEVHPLNP